MENLTKLTTLIGRYDAETKTFTAAAIAKVAGTAGQSAYKMEVSGRLIGLRCMEGGGAATTLQNHIQWKLTNTSWKPNSIEVGIDCRGLLTAPASQPVLVDWPADQPVIKGEDIEIEARNLTADTPVGVDSFLYAIVDVS